MLDELRRRLDVDETTVPDSILQTCLDVAIGLVRPWVTPASVSGPLVTEATIQLAVKVYDLGGRGSIAVDPNGEWVAPAPSATAGLVMSVWGLLGPETETGAAVIA